MPQQNMLTHIDLQKIQELFQNEIGKSVRTELQVHMKAELSKEIGSAVKAELNTQLGPAIQAELNNQLGPAIQAELNTQLVPAIKAELNTQLGPAIKAELAPIRKDIRKIKNDLALTIRFFDGEYMRTKIRVDRIEDHLHLPPIS